MNRKTTTQENKGIFLVKGEKYLTHVPAGIKFSKRSKLRLDKDEHDKLKRLIAAEPSAYSTIVANTGLSYTTIRNARDRGYGQVNTIVKLREFLKKVIIKEA